MFQVGDKFLYVKRGGMYEVLSITGNRVSLRNLDSGYTFSLYLEGLAIDYKDGSIRKLTKLDTALK